MSEKIHAKKKQRVLSHTFKYHSDIIKTIGKKYQISSNHIKSTQESVKGQSKSHQKSIISRSKSRAWQLVARHEHGGGGGGANVVLLLRVLQARELDLRRRNRMYIEQFAIESGQFIVDLPIHCSLKMVILCDSP